MRSGKYLSTAVLAIGVVCFAAIPLIFVVNTSFSLTLSQWIQIWNVRLPALLWNTMTLAFLVALGSFVLGVSCAWLIARRRFSGRSLAQWFMLLPLTIPTYVFSHIYITLLESDGWLAKLWHWLFGHHLPVPDLFNVYGVALVLSLAGFSYVYLLVRMALEKSNQSLEEAARLQGATPAQVFWRVNLPLLRPAIAAGLALVVLHVLSDFGAVSMLRYQTFTLSIYTQMSGRFDYQAAAGLSIVLVLLSLTFLVLERAFRSRQRYYSHAQAKTVQPAPASMGEQILIWSWLGLVMLFSFILPMAWMVYWTVRAVQNEVLDTAFFTSAYHSIIVSASVASLTLILALPVALFHARMRNWLSLASMHFSSVGFVLPGPVIALGILTFILSQLPVIYGSLLALVVALSIRFLPIAIQSQEASLQQLTPSIEQAGQILGASPLENLWRVILPMVKGGLISAWVLVFIDALKELPATLLLRPTGFDTLPVLIWIEASEEMLEVAAPAALMIVLTTFPILWFLMSVDPRVRKS